MGTTVAQLHEAGKVDPKVDLLAEDLYSWYRTEVDRMVREQTKPERTPERPADEQRGQR